ncbi:MAG: arabinan endo-1,5-alpha-L-arabinosidase [Chloroflexi bacterium]|nr:arabinan endo-1,5-alpha-L-arabinosidase [Chloroflexota bacterium]
MTSEDGIAWKRSSGPLQAFEDVPDKKTLWSTELVYHDGIYYLFGEVNTGTYSGIYLATQEGSLIP